MGDRRLAAVMVTDIVGFTALMGDNQERALALLERGHEILKSIVANHRGEWLEDSGDRCLAAFPSAVDAVLCALEVQQKLKDDPDLNLRIGVDTGEIVIAGGHVYGDTVNIAFFIERLADPRGLVITRAVFDAIHGRVRLNVVDLGEKNLKNIGHTRLYALTGVKQRSKATNFVAALTARRIPHVTGAYLAASWAVVEVVEWLAENHLLSRQWVYGVIACLLALLPSVLLVTYTHGAHGPDRLTSTEKIGVPLNLVLAAILAVFVSRQVEVGDNTMPIEKASVAVLPFVNLSGDASGDYFGIGLSEELIHTLTKVPGLYVASRTSSFMFDGQDQDPRSIARKLRVASILEGSVRKDGNQVRITAQLIDGSNNYQLWSDTYQHELEDIFSIQESIARSVSRELVGILQSNALSAISEARAASLEAYDYYLRGLSYLRMPPSRESLANAKALFQRALAEDPRYARAFAAMCEVSLELFILSNSPPDLDVAKTECHRALQLDEDLREVRYALGELHRYTGEYEESARLFREMLDDQPTAEAWVGLARSNVAQGNNDAAEIAFRYAIDREPGNWYHRLAFAEFLYWQGRFEEALEMLRRAVELSPDNARAYLVMGAVYDYLGDLDASIAATKKSIELSPTRAAYRDLGLGYFYNGEYQLAIDAYQRAIELGPDDHWSWGSLALAYLFMEGKEDAAEAAFATAVELASAAMERNERDWATLAGLAMYNVLTGAVEQGVKRITMAVDEGSHLYEVNYYDAVIHAHFGNNDQALRALERALERGSPVRMVARDPLLADLRDDVRFNRLIESRQED